MRDDRVKYKLNQSILNWIAQVCMLALTQGLIKFTILICTIHIIGIGSSQVKVRVLEQLSIHVT